jgi:excisionase family DNA binding protein
MTLPNDRLYSIAEVAQHLGMRPDTVTTWVKSGRLKASRIGRYWRIRPQDLEAFLDAPPPLHPDRPAAPGGLSSSGGSHGRAI